MPALPFRVAVLGGDRREAHAALQLQERGFTVLTVGVARLVGAKLPAWDLQEALAEADAILAPALGLDDKGVLHREENAPALRLLGGPLAAARRGTLLVIGRSRRELAEEVEKYGLRLRTYLERDDFAWMNAVPTAEGAVQVARDLSDVSIHGQGALVTGFGRTAQVLARFLQGWGAHVTVAARRSEARAQARALGFAACDFPEMAERAPEQAFLFNTVPALVVTAEVIRRLPPHAVVVDIASQPGGVDFGACRAAGLPYRLALGLPGRVAARTAGEAVAAVFLEILREEGITPHAG